ncbi:MAG: fucose isomerase [Firmicutes bacterium]|nr:fucose isomerase [Bacillota bacterium]
MLKGIPSILSPDLLKILMEMGHGDTIVIADGNFPGASLARRLIRLDGHGAAPLLDATLRLFPLDTYTDTPVKLMEVVPGDPVETPIWDEYAAIVEMHAPGTQIGRAERFAFYGLAREAYCVIQTGETALYANILLQKGVVLG